MTLWTRNRNRTFGHSAPNRVFFFFLFSYNLLVDVVLYDRRKETKEEEKKVRCFISCLRLRGVGVINSLIEHDQGTTRIIQ